MTIAATALPPGAVNLSAKAGQVPSQCQASDVEQVIMNAPSLNDLRAAFPARDLADEKMNQIRDLLVGDLMRASEARIAALEARVRELETGLGQQIVLLQQRMETLASDHNLRINDLAADHTADHRAAFDELAKSVLDLGDRIRSIPR